MVSAIKVLTLCHPKYNIAFEKIKHLPCLFKNGGTSLCFGILWKIFIKIKRICSCLLQNLVNIFVFQPPFYKSRNKTFCHYFTQCGV